MQRDWLTYERNRHGKGVGRVVSLILCVIMIVADFNLLLNALMGKVADATTNIFDFVAAIIVLMLLVWWLYLTVQRRAHYTIHSLMGIFSYHTIREHLKTQEFTRAFVNKKRKYEVLVSDEWLLLRIRSKSYFYPKKMILDITVRTAGVHATNGYSYKILFGMATGYATGPYLGWSYGLTVELFDQLKQLFPDFSPYGVAVFDDRVNNPTLTKFISKNNVNCIARYPIDFGHWMGKYQYEIRKRYKQLEKMADRKDVPGTIVAALEKVDGLVRATGSSEE